MEKDFVKEVLEDNNTFGGFKITGYKTSKFDKNKKNPPMYGAAEDLTGMTVIHWCTEGHHCNYFGLDLKPNISVTIGKDGDTRTAFNGYVHTKEDFEKVLKLTW
jgi:hypothetical protein